MLERFAVEPRPRATDEDRAALAAMLDIAKARDLAAPWRPLLLSTRDERENLVDVLGACGVLVPPDGEPAARRRPSGTLWSDAVARWRGEDGIDPGRADAVFASAGWRPRGS